MTSETTSTPQGATEAPTPPSTPREGEAAAEASVLPVQYLMDLACEMGHWQHLAFNAAHSPNRAGLTHIAHEIQTKAYELYVLCGIEPLQAKLKAGIILTPAEAQQVQDRIKQAEDALAAKADEERRAESIRRHQDGLHHVPVPHIKMPQGRLAEQ